MNSLYGKLLQDKKGYRNMTPYTSSVDFVRAASKRSSNFVLLTLDDENDRFFGLVNTPKRGGVVLDTPRAVGFAILEETKAMMWQVHYGFYKKTYGSRATLCMTDTDSYIYHIRTENFLADMVNQEAFCFDIIDALTDRELYLSLIHI